MNRFGPGSKRDCDASMDEMSRNLDRDRALVNALMVSERLAKIVSPAALELVKQIQSSVAGVVNSDRQRTRELRLINREANSPNIGSLQYLTFSQRVKLAMEREAFEKALAKQRQYHASNPSGGINQTGGRASEIAAAAYGLKRDAYEQARSVILYGLDEIRAKMESGEMTVNAAFKAARLESNGAINRRYQTAS